MKRIKVRFNLGRGKNFMKWKVQYPNGAVEYYAPSEAQLMMKGCQLRNHKKVAKKIFDGGNKTVCAWVLCNEIEVFNESFLKLDTYCDRVRYNPRVQPNWLLNGEIMDNEKFEIIGSVDSGLYILIAD